MNAEYWATAEKVCTQLELEALRLRDLNDMSPRTICLVLGVSRRSIRDRLDNADRKIALALNTEETAA